MAIILSRTESVCPVCLGRVPAVRAVHEDGKVYLDKSCPEHGSFSALIWEGDEASYRAWGGARGQACAPSDAPSGLDEDLPSLEDGPRCPDACGLCARHESAGCCVLLEVTQRCSLRCPVCFASAGSAVAPDPTLEEIVSLYDMLIEHGGPYHIYLSGGEPTERDDLDRIIALGKERGFTYFQLNTNGLRIAREAGYAQWLRKAGVSVVFLQFDGLAPAVTHMIRGADVAVMKRQAVDRCIEAGLPVVLVPTIVPGVNEGEIGPLLRYALDRAPGVRGVHFQPIAYFGRCRLAVDGESALELSCLDSPRITIPRMLRKIEEGTGGVMRAADFRGGAAEHEHCSFHASYLREDGALTLLGASEGNCCCGSSRSQGFVSRKWALQGEKDAPCCTEAKSEHDAASADMESLDEFLGRARRDTFSVSGMLFQDAGTFDFERLRRCNISEADLARGMAPFCAYNVTSTTGATLFR